MGGVPDWNVACGGRRARNFTCISSTTRVLSIFWRAVVFKRSNERATAQSLDQAQCVGCGQGRCRRWGSVARCVVLPFEAIVAIRALSDRCRICHPRGTAVRTMGSSYRVSCKKVHSRSESTVHNRTGKSLPGCWGRHRAISYRY